MVLLFNRILVMNVVLTAVASVRRLPYLWSLTSWWRFVYCLFSAPFTSQFDERLDKKNISLYFPLPFSLRVCVCACLQQSNPAAGRVKFSPSQSDPWGYGHVSGEAKLEAWTWSALHGGSWAQTCACVSGSVRNGQPGRWKAGSKMPGKIAPDSSRG